MDGWNILRLHLRRIQILQQPRNELFTQIYYNSDYYPILLEWATFKYVCNVFSQQKFVADKSVTITGGKSANLNANVLFISLQNRFATWIHFSRNWRKWNWEMVNTKWKALTVLKKKFWKFTTVNFERSHHFSLRIWTNEDCQRVE